MSTETSPATWDTEVTEKIREATDLLQKRASWFGAFLRWGLVAIVGVGGAFAGFGGRHFLVPDSPAAPGQTAQQPPTEVDPEVKPADDQNRHVAELTEALAFVKGELKALNDGLSPNSKFRQNLTDITKAAESLDGQAKDLTMSLSKAQTSAETAIAKAAAAYHAEQQRRKDDWKGTTRHLDAAMELLGRLNGSLRITENVTRRESALLLNLQEDLKRLKKYVEHERQQTENPERVLLVVAHGGVSFKYGKDVGAVRADFANYRKKHFKTLVFAGDAAQTWEQGGGLLDTPGKMTTPHNWKANATVAEAERTVIVCTSEHKPPSNAGWPVRFRTDVLLAIRGYDQEHLQNLKAWDAFCGTHHGRLLLAIIPKHEPAGNLWFRRQLASLLSPRHRIPMATYEGKAKPPKVPTGPVGQPPETQPPKGKPPEGQTPEGKTPEGKTPKGKTPEGKTPEGKTPEGKTPEGKTPEGKPPEGKSPEGKSPKGKPPKGKPPKGQTPDGQTQRGENSKNQGQDGAGKPANNRNRRGRSGGPTQRKSQSG